MWPMPSEPVAGRPTVGTVVAGAVCAATTTVVEPRSPDSEPVAGMVYVLASLGIVSWADAVPDVAGTAPLSPHYRMETMTSYAVKQDNVVHDTIDGEVLAIRSDTGAYYSMTGTSATTWVALLTSQALDHVVDQVARHHNVEPKEATDAIHTFAESLVGETLLIKGDVNALCEPIQLPVETASVAWVAPSFEKFTDMQDLLLFDPIHEVQPSGWPRAADPTT